MAGGAGRDGRKVAYKANGVGRAGKRGGGSGERMDKRVSCHPVPPHSLPQEAKSSCMLQRSRRSISFHSDGGQRKGGQAYAEGAKLPSGARAVPNAPCSGQVLGTKQEWWGRTFRSCSRSVTTSAQSKSRNVAKQNLQR
eukprot:364252-Chlamydomonas_euryale.AAC.2